MLANDREYITELNEPRPRVELLREYEDIKGDKGRLGTWTPTYSGHRFWVLDPRPEEIDPIDIAYGLSRINRFNGATIGNPYSVAQHSLRGADEIAVEYKQHFLLHDATEAYIGDLVSPVKDVVNGDYQAIESRIEAAIAARFGLTWTEEAYRAVKEIDNRMLVTEMWDLRPYSFYRRSESKPFDWFIDVLPWEESYNLLRSSLHGILRENGKEQIPE